MKTRINNQLWAIEIDKHTLTIRERQGKLQGFFILIWVKNYCVLHQTQVKPLKIAYWLLIGLYRASYYLITGKRLYWLWK